MRALDPEVFDAVWATVEPLVPVPADGHPLGCHRPRCPDRDCFDVIVVRLSTGCSWEDAERLCGSKVSDTTVRQRRAAWLAAGVFDAIVEEAMRAFDRIVGLDRSGQARMEVVGTHRPSRDPDRVDRGGGQPQRLDPARSNTR
jgi:transposase